MNIHEEIKELLVSGKIVYSFAVGRVGQIMHYTDHPVAPIEICPRNRPHDNKKGHRHQHGATTFLSGDPVQLQRRFDYADQAIWVVVNTELANKEVVHQS